MIGREEESVMNRGVMEKRDEDPFEAESRPHIRVEGLVMAYGEKVIQRDLSFTIGRGEIFIIMGGSGCGKSTLLRHLIGLMPPAAGRIDFDGVDFWGAGEKERARLMRRCGVLYQRGALWSSLNLMENIALPLREYTGLKAAQVRELVSLKLSLVGLPGFEGHYPAQLSGGQQKRAALARAMALDPEILFLDEPSAGLDPISARQLDDLILELRESLGSTVVVVTHELASIFAIGTNSVFLDAEEKTMIDQGPPRQLLEKSSKSKVRRFLTRGEEGRDNP